MNGSFFIAPIVEGHGEVQAVPVLLRRIAEEPTPPVHLNVNPPLRVKVGSFLNDDAYFRRHVELAARKAKAWSKSCVLILLDCEDDCPRDLGPQIAARARACRNDVVFIVILAHREYETWFLAASRSLAGQCGLPLDVVAPREPEAIRDAKGWLSERMHTPYNEPEHQPRFTASFSFEEAATVHSFRRGLDRLRAFFASRGSNSSP